MSPTCITDLVAPLPVPARIRLFFSDSYWPEHVCEAPRAHLVLQHLGLDHVFATPVLGQGVSAQEEASAQRFIDHLALLNVVRSFKRVHPDRAVPGDVVLRVKTAFDILALDLEHAA